MRFYGFHWVKEWDNSMAKVSVVEERADLSDWLKYRIDFWYLITYSDQMTHRVPDYVFKEMDQGVFDPNVYANNVPH